MEGYEGERGEVLQVEGSMEGCVEGCGGADRATTWRRRGAHTLGEREMIGPLLRETRGKGTEGKKE